MFLQNLFLLHLPLGQNAQAASGGNISQLVIMVGVAIAFFYFILYRPEQKRRKKAEQMRSSIKKGDKVKGGISVLAKI